VKQSFQVGNIVILASYNEEVIKEVLNKRHLMHRCLITEQTRLFKLLLILCYPLFIDSL